VSKKGELSGAQRDRALNLGWHLPGDTRLLAPFRDLPPRHGATTEAIIAQSIAEHLRNPGGFVSYARRRQWYAERRRYFGARMPGYETVVAAVDRLAEAGYLVHDKRVPGHRGWQSRFRASEWLIGIAEHDRIAPTRPFDPGELIRLRDKDGKLVDYRDTAETRRMRRSLRAINDALRYVAIDLGAEASAVRIGDIIRFSNTAVCLSPRGLYRVFNGDFACGGRFYGPGYQGLPKRLRHHLLIDGNRTVELDYGQTHPRLLAARLGVDLGPRDIYAVDGWPRPIVKTAFQVLVNAETMHAGIGAISLEMGSFRERARAVECAEAIKRRHPQFSPAFGSGAGLRLQRTDSEIAEDVLHRLLRRGMAVLPVHDSFIVERQNAWILEREMVAAWRQKTRANPIIESAA
jgi:hypothetical protein